VVEGHRTPGLQAPQNRRGSAAGGFHSVAGLMSSRRFFRLLSRRTPKNAAAIDRRIEECGMRELSVLMCDSSGFSRKTHDYGVLQFLATMTQCYDRLIPLLERRHGICLSHNADNILAIFEHPAQAVRAALDMHLWLRRHNRGKPDAEQFNICIGIHHGPVVRLADNVFGATVNVAAKVGEDLAGRDQILVTGEVAERLPRGRCRAGYDRSAEIGGRSFSLFRVEC